MLHLRVPFACIVATCIILSGATACRPQSAPRPAWPTPTSEPLVLPSATVLPSLPTATPGATGVEPAFPANPERAVYVFSSGLSLRFPQEWLYETSDETRGVESVRFRPLDPSAAAILVEVAHRPRADQAVTDPFTWVPNEGGYDIHWSEAVTAAGLEGLKFVWGVQREGVWEGLPSLMAVIYDPERELDIRLTTEFTRRQLEATSQAGLEGVLSTQFGLFTELLGSLEYLPGEGFMILAGTVAPGASLGDRKSYCPEGLYLVAEDGFLIGQTSILLMRTANPGDQPGLFDDRQWNGTTVRVTGQYPVQEMLCEALACECEDYVLVDHIAPY